MADNGKNLRAKKKSSIMMAVNSAKVFEGEAETRPTLVVIGGGFAGTLACRKMTKEFRVVLVDAKEYFEYYPGICRAYVHPREHRKLSRHYQSICDHFNVTYLWGEVQSVNSEAKQLQVKEMAKTELTTMHYDYLLVTSGSQYGINLVHPLRASMGTECLWYPTFLEEGLHHSKWEGLDERFLSGRRKHLVAEYEQLQEIHKKRQTILVLGAGFVGIEFATEVKFYFPDIDVVVVEQRDCCVGVMPKDCIDYCQEYMERNGIKTLYGEKYTKFLAAECSGATGVCDADEAQLKATFDNLPQLAKDWGIEEPIRIYMAVGLRPINQFMPGNTVTKGRRGGWITTNKHQQVLCEDKPLPGVFAAGNCCQIEGLSLPKNSFPGEDMAAVACHNIRVAQAAVAPKSFGCFGFLRPRKLKETHWGWGTGLCATSLGPHDATLVAGSTEESGSGRTVLKGTLAALNKEFIRWSKVDQIAGGCIGTIVWKLIH